MTVYSPYSAVKSNYNNRTLDPSVFNSSTASHNLSLAATLPAFQKLWQEVKHVLMNQTNQVSSEKRCLSLPFCCRSDKD